MILQALYSYYNRLANDPEEDVPRPGYSREKIHFALILAPDGTLMAVDDLREKQGKKTFPQEMLVPAAVKRTVAIQPNFLWDNSGYVLGADAKGKPERAGESFIAFRDLIRQATASAQASTDPGLAAVRAFLDAWDPSAAPERIAAFQPWEEVAGWNLVFRLDGERTYVHERPAAREAWERLLAASAKGARAFCLITGEEAPIARLNPAIKGVRGAQSSGAALVSFNLDAFTSHGKEQNYNAPMSEAAAFAYSTALNHLLRPGSRRRMQIADATTVFWSEKPTELEDLLGLFMESKADESEEASGDPADDGGIAKEVREILKAVRDGRMPPELGDANVPFYILGLAPNAARLSVRFFEVSSTGEIAARVGRHFSDIAIERAHPRNPEFPGMWQLLIELAPLRKSENIPPVLGGALMRAILGGRSYPRSLLTLVIGRIRADHEVTYLRAALLKGYFTRAPEALNMEVGMSLDTQNTQIGYQLGRLFAVLEKAQQDALPGINATIKDRFYGAASSTPASVFPRLIRLAQHHISKAEYGRSSDRRLGEIMENIGDFPPHLSLEQQGLFALGYYHQRNALWKKSDAEAAPADAPNPEAA